MFNNYSTIRLYGGAFLDELFSAILKRISDEVSSLSDEVFLAKHRKQYAIELTEKYTLDIPIIEFDKAYVKTIEREIPAERFPAEFAVFRGKSYKKDIIVYHLPYSGDIDLLTYKPNTFSTFSGYPFEIDRKEECILIEIINFYNNPDLIKRAYEDTIHHISRDYGAIFSNCVKFNSDLESSITGIISNREEKIEEKNSFLSSLGVPIKNEEKKENANSSSSTINKKKPDNKMYDLAISFAGEDRKVAEEIATELTDLGYTVFYDRYEQANLWGKDLYDHLNEIYSKRAKFCLMIISKNYADKHWTNHERKAAQARAFTQNKEYILPLRLDETQIPGLNVTVGYVSYNQTGLKGTVNLLREKIDSWS